MDFDTILPLVGEYGKYQKLLLWFILFPAVLPCGFHAYNQLFMAAKPAHWCRVPELEALSSNITLAWIRRLSSPKGQNFQCTMFDRNYTLIAKQIEAAIRASQDETSLETALESLVPNESLNEVDTREEVRIVHCPHGRSFDSTDFVSTVVTEWDMVCEKDFYPTLALILLGLAGCVGNFIFGYLQDTLGRKPAFYIYLLIECVFGIATAFAPDFITWTVFRVGVGFTVPAILGTPYVLGIEVVGPTKRTTVTILSNIAYSLSLVLLGIVVYLVRDWRWLSIATCVPFLVLFLCWWVLPESPRWLVARGRYAEAEQILRRMARVNGKRLEPLQLRQKFEAEASKKFAEIRPSDRNYGLLDLVRTPNLRRKTLLITFIWFTNTTVYVGLSYYAPALGGDEFLNFFLAGAVELPTYLYLWPAMLYCGRRLVLCWSMIVGGAACLATVLVQDQPTVTLALYCIGKMGISSSFVVLPLMASELYPTVVRGLGMSFSSVVGMLGPIFIPLVNHMGAEFLVLPLLVMGSLLMAGGCCSLMLPETFNQHLPQTLEDGERFGKDQSPCGGCCTSVTRNQFLIVDTKANEPTSSTNRNDQNRSSTTV